MSESKGLAPEVRAYLEQVRDNPGIIDEAGSDAAGAAASARALGIALDADAAEQAAAVLAQLRAARDGADGQLSDDQLDRVAGGISWGKVVDDIIKSLFG